MIQPSLRRQSMLPGIVLLFAVVFQARADAEDPFRLVETIRPVFQSLNLSIDPAKTHYSGSTTIRIAILEKTQNIRLHARDMQINELQLRKDGQLIASDFRFGEHGLLHVGSALVLTEGEYELEIAFENDFNVDGVGINRTEADGEHYIFSQFEAIDARQAFPCFDEPGFKFPWQLTMTVPAEMMPITNTPELTRAESNGMKTIVFDKTPPLSSYLIAVAVGPFEAVPIPGMSIPGRVIVPKGKAHLAAAAVETTPPLLAYLEDYFGEPYPFKKLDLIATYQSFSGAMEHPGAITYSDFFLLLDDTASQRQQATLIKITAHELAHQWFGNLVTMQWWDDLWLNESFADWMGDKTVDEVYPEFSAGLDELRTIFFIMDVDARPTTKAIRHDFKSTDNFEDGVFLSYFKGKAVLGMFETAVGAEVFREGVVRYLRKYSRKNASAANLWTEIDSEAEFELAEGLAGFIDRPGIPLISVEALGDGRYAFSQSRLSTGPVEDDASPWIIPLTYSYRVGDNIVDKSALLTEQRQIFDIGRDVDWLMPNADQRGYYRWRIPDAMLERLGEDATTHLSVRERMGLLTNLWALLSTGEVSGERFLTAISDLSADTDPSVMSALLDQLGNVVSTFITAELRPLFDDYLRAVLQPTLQRIGYEPVQGESGEIAALRPRILLWLADRGQDPDVQTVTAGYLQRFLDGEIPASNIVDASMRAEARRGDLALFETFRARLGAATTPNERRRYVQAIGSFRDPEAVDEVLKFVRSEPLQAIDVSAILGGLARWEDNRPMLLEWLMQHDAELRERLPAGAMARIPDRFGICDPAVLPTLRSFYGAAERAVPGIEGELEDVEAEVMECHGIRQREIDSVRRHLSSIAM